MNRYTPILIVEDNNANQFLLNEFLKILGFDAEIAANGLIAIKLLEAKPFALILMDVVMPEMDGVQATETIRSHTDEQIRKIPIIGISAKSRTEDVERYLVAGMNDYLSKPVDMNLLSQMIKKYLD